MEGASVGVKLWTGEHLKGLLDRLSDDLEDLQRGQLAEALLEFVFGRMDWGPRCGLPGGFGICSDGRVIFNKTLMGVGAPVGELRSTTRRLRSANGSQIDILGCSFCVVSFLGLRSSLFWCVI